MVKNDAVELPRAENLVSIVRDNQMELYRTGLGDLWVRFQAEDNRLRRPTETEEILAATIRSLARLKLGVSI